MKKILVILAIFVGMFTLSACDRQEPVANFIPTPTPLAQVDEDKEATKEESNLDDEEGGPVYQGSTTTMYVKLSTSDGTLNIRDNPSADGQVVGFLVHTEKVEVIDIEDGWASFVYQDEISYVSDEYLVDEKPDYINP